MKASAPERQVHALRDEIDQTLGDKDLDANLRIAEAASLRVL
jgi:hypothetical protein